LRSQGHELGLPLVRLRKMVTFERFVARLAVAQPGYWLVKGGLALQWRLGNLARTTKDVDMLLTAPLEDVHQALVRAGRLDLGDWFSFLVQKPTTPSGQRGGAGLRMQVQSLVDSRPFEAFHLDVGWGDPVVEPPDELTLPSLLEFAGINAVTALCFPLTQHIAEKLHAYTRPHISGESSRAKDLVDILLIARASVVDARALSRAIRATFEARGTHGLPDRLPGAPASWNAPFSRMAREVGLRVATLTVAVDMAGKFLDPVLQSQAQGRWDPALWQWR
jgi:hypothetical protein